MNATSLALDQIASFRLVPVVAIPQASQADPLAEALIAGGLPVAEITFRTEAAEAAIAAMSRRRDILVGAGTVLSIEQAKRAVGAGASFIVAPGTDPAVVTWCLEHNVTITPGVATPSDITAALSLGVNVVKFFPAEAYGGMNTLRALAAPFGGVRFIPTGGITADNVAEYLSFKPVIACGGSWMVNKQWIASGDFDRITQTTRRAVAAATDRED